MDHDRLVRFVHDDYARVVAAVGFACGDRSRAEDAVQDVLEAALQHPSPVHNPPAWVATAAMNRVRSRVRRLEAEQRALGRLVAKPETPAAPSELSDKTARALRSLPERQREVTALHYLLDMSVADIAQSLGISPGAVKAHLHRAREALRTQLAPNPSGRANEGDVGHVNRSTHS